MSEINFDDFWDAHHKNLIRKTFPDKFFDKNRENTEFIVVVYNDNRAIVEMNIQTIDELEIMASSSLWKRLKNCSCKINAVKENHKILVNKRNGNYREPALVLEKLSPIKEQSFWQKKKELLTRVFK